MNQLAEAPKSLTRYSLEMTYDQAADAFKNNLLVWSNKWDASFQELYDEGLKAKARIESLPIFKDNTSDAELFSWAEYSILRHHGFKGVTKGPRWLLP